MTDDHDTAETEQLGEAADKPEEEQFQLKQVYAFISRDGDGDEGVVSIVTPTGNVQPLISFDARNLDQMREIAQHIASETKKDVRLLRFSAREDVETFEPRMIQPA